MAVLVQRAEVDGMPKLHYDPVTDWTLCAAVPPDVLVRELRAIGFRFTEPHGPSACCHVEFPEGPYAFCVPYDHDDAAGWRDAVVNALSPMRQVLSLMASREVTQWAVLRRLLWRSGAWWSLVRLLLHWLGTRPSRWFYGCRYATARR